jgi:hypothetical protein
MNRSCCFLYRCALAIILLLLINTARAQGYIQVRTNNTNYLYFGPKEIWNIQIISTKPKVIQAKIEAFVTNSKGALIFQSASGIVNIKPGVEIFNSQSLSVIRNNAVDKQTDQFLRLTQSFPNGEYSVCYTIRELNNSNETEIPSPITNCIDLVSEIQSPLILNTPNNGAEINTQRPSFTWIPPMPLSTLSGFSYNFFLYAADPKKSCEEVVSNAIPIYRTSGIFSSAIGFPNELSSLDTSKHYCWRVEGVSGNSVLANSELWRFKIKNEVLEFDTLRYAHFVENPAAIKIKSNTVVMCDFDGVYFGDTLKAFISGEEMINQELKILKVEGLLGKNEKQPNYSHSKYIIDPKFIAQLKPGIYIIKAETKSFNQKFIKLHIN